ncbi:unnamed protein product [Echinostoma caproni]|uniref:Uncharacterized protein n=1 Tax=Echinostoma caproni TaxID=27848 RepID=A0A3P8HCX1_9TREM|nr:unnamed protein product [Echinostoma caproni]
MASALSEMTSVHDFLAVADDQMREDFQKSLQALSERNETGVQQTSGAMQRRSAHVCDVVSQKLSEQTADLEYVDHVMEKVTLLRDEYTPTFTEVSRDTLSRLAARHRVEEGRYRQAGSNLCSALHEVRLAALNESNLPSELEALRLKQATSELELDKHSVDGARSTRTKSPDLRELVLFLCNIVLMVPKPQFFSYCQ